MSTKLAHLFICHRKASWQLKSYTCTQIVIVFSRTNLSASDISWLSSPHIFVVIYWEAFYWQTCNANTSDKMADMSLLLFSTDWHNYRSIENNDITKPNLGSPMTLIDMRENRMNFIMNRTPLVIQFLISHLYISLNLFYLANMCFFFFVL